MQKYSSPVWALPSRNGRTGLRGVGASGIIPAGLRVTMLKPATLFQFLNEFIMLLLGALLIVLAVSGRVGLPGRPLALALLGVVLIYWGVRASLRPEPEAHLHQVRIRAGSLVVVGILMIAIPLLPVRYAEYLLELAGGVLVLRGILGSALLLRRA